MNNFKKYPIFTVVFVLLLLVFVGGGIYDYCLISDNSKVLEKIKRAKSSFISALKDDPGKANLDLADKNIKLLEEKLDILDEDLSNKGKDILRKSPYSQGYALQEYMRSTTQKWAMDAQEKGIDISARFDFAFGKYVQDNAKPIPDEAVNAIWKQFNVLEYIIKQLVDSKDSDSPLKILSVQREMLPEEKQAAQAEAAKSNIRRKVLSDIGTFEIDKFITARKEGSISALAYKISFSGYTDTMRRFLNNLNSYDLMLVVRSVEVKPYVGTANATSTKKAAVADEFSDFFADDDKKSAEEKPVVQEVTKEPVVSENLSEFTVVVEYIEVDKSMPAPARVAENAEEE